MYCCLTVNTDTTQSKINFTLDSFENKRIPNNGKLKASSYQKVYTQHVSKLPSKYQKNLTCDTPEVEYNFIGTNKEENRFVVAEATMSTVANCKGELTELGEIKLFQLERQITLAAKVYKSMPDLVILCGTNADKLNFSDLLPKHQAAFPVLHSIKSIVIGYSTHPNDSVFI